MNYMEEADFLGAVIVTTSMIPRVVRNREQVRFSSRKRKRIVKKFSKDTRNYGWKEEYPIVKQGNTLYMHPETAERISKGIETLPLKAEKK